MSARDHRHHAQYHLLHVLLFCLILLVVVLLLVNKRAADTYQTGLPSDEASSAAEVEDEDEPAAMTKVCQTPTGAVVVPAADPCPPGQTTAGDNAPHEEAGEQSAALPVEAESPGQPDLPAPTASLGQYFTFGGDLDLRADAFTCQSVRTVVAGGKSLAVVRENYEQYGDESLPLAERLAVDGSIFYEYIDRFDRHLNQAGAKQAADDVVDYLDLYQECALTLTGKHTGPQPRTLPDGCGLSFPRAVSLLTTTGASIGPNSFRALRCTKEIVNLPFGGTNDDTQYFLLKAAAEVAVIVIDNQARPGLEAVIAGP